MVALPVVKVVLPTDLVGVVNGKLLPHQVVEIGPSGWLHRNAARSWKAMKLAAEGDLGRPLTWTYGGTYRNYNAQSTVWFQRMTTTPTPAQKRAAKVVLNWDGKTWYLVGGARVAKPGESNHGLGLAIDVAYGDHPSRATSVDNAWRDWAIANAHKFGFSFETQSEIWHLRYVAGDSIPQLVLDIEAFLSAPAPLPPPPPAPEIPPFQPELGQWSLMPLTPHSQRPRLDLRSGLDANHPDRAWVLYAQWVMELKSIFKGYVETGGVYNDNTKAIVGALQRHPYIDRPSTGVIEADDWRWIDSLAGGQ